eukprot:4504963-Amphidinium_carterae.1
MNRLIRHWALFASLLPWPKRCSPVLLTKRRTVHVHNSTLQPALYPGSLSKGIEQTEGHAHRMLQLRAQSDRPPASVAISLTLSQRLCISLQ